MATNEPIIVPSAGTCIDLALEGERKCKSGDCRTGVAYFEAAINVGTEDLKTLSAVYSQLGNAYFYLKEYERALEFHRHDLTLARTLGDRLGEAKASGNLGNTLKVLGKFEEAIFCCTRHLDTSRELNDKVGEARALYNLGNVFHAKGKHLGRARHRDPGDFPLEVREALERAVEFYEENLKLVSDLQDRPAEGRAFGNLGNTHYLLGNFDKAIQYHEKRLMIAREFNDRPAERRAYSNLGNAHVFIGEFECAVEYYKKTRILAKELQDRAIEAQACYSLGNTHTLLKMYEPAMQYHLEHLHFAKEFNDRVGEGRAYWSLGNVCTSLGKHGEALDYAQKHLVISKEVGDRTGELTAEMNIVDLKAVLGMTPLQKPTLLPNQVQDLFAPGQQSMEINSRTPSVTVLDQVNFSMPASDEVRVQRSGGDEDMFDLISRVQTSRMNDQRCSLPGEPGKPAMGARPKSAIGTSSTVTRNKDTKQARPKSELKPKTNGSATSVSTENLLDLLAKAQDGRMDEQRSGEASDLPGLSPIARDRLMSRTSSASNDGFLDMLMRSQASRINDQRYDPDTSARGPTVPDEDFFNLITRLQSKRIDNQRATFNQNDRKGSY